MVQCVDFSVTFNVSFNLSCNVSSEAIQGEVSCEVAWGNLSQYIDFSPKWGQNWKKNQYIDDWIPNPGQYNMVGVEGIFCYWF